MNYAIIAAGEGSRLAMEGVKLPKPLVKLNDEALIDRLIRIFQDNNADEIAIIVNSIHPEVERHIRNLNNPQIKLIVKNTPSSMHSFFELSKHTQLNDFCLTTVDTIFDENEFHDFIKMFSTSSDEIDGLMAVTDYIDDEKPLYVATDDSMKITGFHDIINDGDIYISGGIYALKSKSITTLKKCIDRGESRMRNFQRALIDDGENLRAITFSKVLDVDHAADIDKAADFLNKKRQ